MKRARDLLLSGFYRLQRARDVGELNRLLRYRRLRNKFYDDYWKRAAADIGARVKSLEGGFAMITQGELSTIVNQGNVMLDSHLTLRMMGNKGITNSLMEMCGLSVIPHEVFSIGDVGIALRFLEEHGGPVVVKPASGTGGGRGVTTGIRSGRALKHAVRIAARYCNKMIIESQVDGASYRLLYLEGELIDALRRDPPCVTGDGTSNIRTLIRQENVHRLACPPYRALSPLVIDDDCKNWLSSQKLSLKSIPKSGDIVQVKLAANENSASENVNVIEELSTEISTVCSNVVTKLNVQLAGVDLFCKDISGAFEPGNCIIGEVNTTPGLHHHALIRNEDKMAHVGKVVLEHMFATGIGTMRLVP
jgi:cyanophycin synthetase